MKCDDCNIEMDDNVCPNCKTICNDCADKLLEVENENRN